MKIKSIVLIALLFTFAMSAQASADEDALPNWPEETLTGGWGGLRANLYKQGFNFGLTHKSDFLANVSGGLKQGSAWLGHTEIKLSLDLEKFLGWNGTTMYMHYHSNLGSKFNTQYVGGFMGVDNIEVGTNTAQFYQAWVQKNFLDDHVSLLTGLYAIDSEFYVTETSGLFLQPPYGMANEVAQTGVNGPPIFPLGALAVRTKLTSPSRDFYLQAALTDGVPGDPNNPRGTHIKLGNGDGTLSIVEIGYTPHEINQSVEPAAMQEATETYNKTAIGFWRYSTQFDTYDGSRQHNQGLYILAERSLFRESGHPSQGLAGFIRFGLASEAVNQADWSGSVGLRYHGLIAGRDNDIAGLALTVNHAGDAYRHSKALSGNPTDRQETNFEATYRAQVTPYFAVQPTLQIIANPSMDATIKTAWILGSRFEIEF